MDKLDAMCRILKQFRGSGSPKLQGLQDWKLVELAERIIQAGEDERNGLPAQTLNDLMQF
jgi:hypothetical protein